MTDDHVLPTGGNFRLLYPRCAPRPNPALQTHPPEWYVGTSVKRAFRGGGHTEHMWVLIDGVTDTGDLVGMLDNIPVLVPGLNLDDRVVVAIAEIEDISDDEPEEAA